MKTFLFVPLLIFSLVFGASLPVQDRLLSNLAKKADLIRDMSAKVDFKVRVAGLGLTFNAHGIYYYKRPDRVRLKLIGFPSFLARHQDEIFRSADVMTGLPRDISSEYHVARILKKERDYIMVLLPNEKRRVSKVYVWVEDEHYTLPRVVFQYHDGSSVRLQSQYVPYQNLFLVKTLQTDYELTNPSLQANVLATFSDFRVNQGLPDSIFAEK